MPQSDAAGRVHLVYTTRPGDSSFLIIRSTFHSLTRQQQIVDLQTPTTTKHTGISSLVDI